jgi:hypothetical protein
MRGANRGQRELAELGNGDSTLKHQSPTVADRWHPESLFGASLSAQILFLCRAEDGIPTRAIPAYGGLFDQHAETPSAGRTLRRSFRLPGWLRRGYRSRYARKCAVSRQRLRAISGFSSGGLQKPLATLANFFMGQILTAAKRCVTAFDGSDNAGLFVKILRENVLYQLVRVAPLLRR